MRFFGPRFTLRTLFIIVTLLACWLGYQLNWFRQRHNFRDEMNTTQKKDYVYFAEDSVAKYPFKFFGEPSFKSIGFNLDFGSLTAEEVPRKKPKPADQKNIDRARQLFPEAVIEDKSGYYQIVPKK